MLTLEDVLLNVIHTIKSSEEFKKLPKKSQRDLEKVINMEYLSDGAASTFEGDEETPNFPQPNEKQVYQLKISLKGAHPPIWRRVLVPNTITLHQLHETIQEAMGWESMHLYNFEYGGVLFELPSDDFFLPNFRETYNSREIQLGSILVEEKQKLTYTYDFGDDWEHTILLEKIEDNQDILSPKCLKGKRACPLEDSGGIHHYQYVLEMLQDPSKNDEEAEHFREWFGDHDPEDFDFKETNRALSTIKFK